MEISKSQLEILSLYDTNLVALFSMNQIAKDLGKPYPFVNRKVNALIDAGILNRTVIGRSHLCSLNLESQETIILMSMIELEKKRRHDFKELDSYIGRKSASGWISCVVVSAGRIIFVVTDLKQRLELQKQYPESLVLDKQEFQNYLVETESIFRDHVVVYGTERFFEILREVLFELKKRHSPLRY
jgi:hypothetical protein